MSFVDIVNSAGNKSRKVSFVDEVTGHSMGRMDLEGQEKIRDGFNSQVTVIRFET